MITALKATEDIGSIQKKRGKKKSYFFWLKLGYFIKKEDSMESEKSTIILRLL